eukprot:1473885-Alexandrium_andersonii.AAC.1
MVMCQKMLRASSVGKCLRHEPACCNTQRPCTSIGILQIGTQTPAAHADVACERSGPGRDSCGI